jgi:hypothetical protein
MAAQTFGAFDAKPKLGGAQTSETRTKQPIANVERTSRPIPGTAYDAAPVANDIPAMNIEASCHAAENLAVGESADLCRGTENKAHDLLAQRWTEFPSTDRSHCVQYSSSGGGGTYTDLLTCLEMELHARHIKQRAFGAVERSRS